MIKGPERYDELLQRWVPDVGHPDYVSEIAAPEFGELTGVIEDRPELPAECWIDKAVDIEKAWLEVERSCRGG